MRAVEVANYRIVDHDSINDLLTHPALPHPDLVCPPTPHPPYHFQPRNIWMAHQLKHPLHYTVQLKMLQLISILKLTDFFKGLQSVHTTVTMIDLSYCLCKKKKKKLNL